MELLKNIISLHKKTLPKDPLYLFKKNKIKSFFLSIINCNWVYCKYDIDNSLIGFAIVFPIQEILILFKIIFLSTFSKSTAKRKKSIYYAKQTGILIYICISGEYQNKGYGSSLIKKFSEKQFKQILLITKPETYKSFYRKLGADKINIFNKCFCRIRL